MCIQRLEHLSKHEKIHNPIIKSITYLGMLTCNIVLQSIYDEAKTKLPKSEIFRDGMIA